MKKEKQKQAMIDVGDDKIKEMAKLNAKAKGMTLKGYVSSLIKKDA